MSLWNLERHCGSLSESKGVLKVMVQKLRFFEFPVRGAGSIKLLDECKDSKDRCNNWQPVDDKYRR